MRRVAVAVGVLALLAAGWFGYLTLRGAPAPSGTREVAASTHRVAARGFSIGVPHGMHVSRRHGTLILTNRKHDLVVTVGRTGAGPLRRAAHRFVRSLRDGYRRVRVLGHQPQTIGGRQALATYGQAFNRRHVRLRFVTVAVRARPRDYVITAFTTYGSDPHRVLPQVNAIASTFRIRGH